MITINLQCTCGQKLAFDVEPVLGKMPWPVKCPVCGADQTALANQIIARDFAGSTAGLTLRSSQTENAAPPPIRKDPSLGFRNTYASNPALLRVDWARATASRPAALGVSVAIAVFGLLVMIAFKAVPGICLIVAAIWSYAKHHQEVKRKFWAGDVCPGVILSDKQVAVMTDLKASGAVKRPALKVMWYPVKKMTGGLPPIGSRVATVALYYGPVNDGAWRNFSPEVIACWVSDEAEIQRVTNSITEQEWRDLEALLAQIPKPVAGLYKMWGSEAGKVKRVMDPAVEMIVATLIGLILFGPLTFAMIGKWKARHSEQPTAARSAEPVTIAHPSTTEVSADKTAASSTPIAPASTAPQTNNTATQVRVAVPVLSLDLGSQIATFTNLQGKSFDNVKLVRADARSGLVYSFEGGAGSIPFNTLPAEFLLSLGVPTNWPGVLGDKQTAATNAAVVAAKPRTGLFEVGDRVQVSWAGKWEPAVILAFRNHNIVVRFTSPTTPIHNELYVPTNWVRLAR